MTELITKNDLNEALKEAFYLGTQHSKENISNLSSTILENQASNVKEAVNESIDGQLVIIQEHLKTQDEHLKKQDKTIANFEKRMEPVLKAFENKKIIRMAIEQETKTWVFYTTSVITFGAFLTGVWAIVKFIFIK